jgi:endonuclease-8
VTLGALDTTARQRLADTAFALTQQAYRSRGVTNDLQRAARLKAEGLGYAHYRHHVFARAGLGCWTCDTVIERVYVSGRAVFFCPRCTTGA